MKKKPKKLAPLGCLMIGAQIEPTIYNGIIINSLNHVKIFESIPDEPRSTSISAVRHITCAVIYTSNEVYCLLLLGWWIYNFSQIILERVLVGSFVNIRNECHFFCVHGEWIRAWSKQTNHPRTPSQKVRNKLSLCLRRIHALECTYVVMVWNHMRLT